MKSFPIWAEKLLRAICPEELFEQIEGDLMEIYNYDVKTVGKRKAKLKFVISAIRFFRPGILLRNSYSMQLYDKSMVKNYLITLIRLAKKEKQYFAIKILSLSVGFACAMILFIYINHELSYDKFLHESDRIYRITSHYQGAEAVERSAEVPNPVGIVLKDKMPEIEKYTRLQRGYKRLQVRFSDKNFIQDGIFIADSTFLDVFNFRILAGDHKALSQGFSIVLTKPLAEKIFGDVDPMGKTLTLATGWELGVTGVIEPPPANSHLKFTALISWATFSAFDNDKQWETPTWLYVKLAKNINRDQFNDKLSSVTKKEIVPLIAKKESDFDLSAQPVTDIHLRSKLNDEISPNGNIGYIKVFSVLIIFFLIISAFNYINLATVSALGRVKEIGIRKVHGALRKMVSIQFLFESAVFVSLAVLIGIAITAYVVKPFSYLVERDLAFTLGDSATSIAGILLFTLVMVIGAGFYPSILAARTNLAAIVKGNGSTRQEKFSLKQILIVVQISISIIVIIATSIVYTQMHFVSNMDLGIKKDNVLIVNLPITPNYPARLAEVFKNDLSKIANVGIAGRTQFMMGMEPWKEKYSVEQSKGFIDANLAEIFMEPEFIDILKIKLKQGRNFEPGRSTDFSSSLIINETAAKAFGWTAPIGKRIKNPDIKGEVIGVVKDFHTSSFHNKIEPLIFRLPWEPNASLDFFYLKLNSNKDIKTTMASIENAFKKAYPNYPFQYNFLDDKYNQLYKSDINLGKTLSIAAVVVGIISLLGLVSLSAFYMQKQTKGAGIRKVLGASFSQLSWLHARKFLLLTGYANFIAWPFAYFMMTYWLRNFEYKTALQWYTFLLAGLLAVVLVLLTTASHSLRLAKVNPIDHLKSE